MKKQICLTVFFVIHFIFFVTPLSLGAQDYRLPVPMEEIFAPVSLFSPVSNGGSLITDPEGILRYIYRLGAGNEGSGALLYADISRDGGETWHFKQILHNTGEDSRSEIAEVNPYTGEIYLMYTRSGGRLIKTTKMRSQWDESIALPFTINFTTGSFIWLSTNESSEFYRMVAAVPVENGVVTYISDDDGETWQGPSNLLTSPEFSGRWLNPAGSPQIIELHNGKLWMLMRNSQDHLWEYYSDDRGETWSQGRASRFTGVFSNVRLRRIPDGRLLIMWLNCMPRTGVTREGSFHNTARDVLHAAISNDDGLTWRGFREVMRGKRRHSLIFSQVPAYDAGVHHQKFAVTKEKKVIVFSGQDDNQIDRETGHRQAVIFDLEWLYQPETEVDFSAGYEDLCVFKLSQERWGDTNYYSRVLGATLIEHPEQPFRKVLQLGREKCEWVFNQQDGASWNFPIGKKGELTTRILLRNGFKGGLISLIDVFYNPSDPGGEEAAMYVFDIPADRAVNLTSRLETGQWYDIKLAWDGTDDTRENRCRVFINDIAQPWSLRLLRPSRNGISYVRFRSTAEEEDLAGFLVESIRAKVEW